MRIVTSADFRERNCALVVGHPGHELRAWGWMHATRPLVGVLTDGGGHAERSRLHLSRDLCVGAGAVPSGWFGAITDREIYQALLAHDTTFFLRLADAVTRLLLDAKTDCIVSDAHEGYNPTHDLCRMIVDRAVNIARTYGAVESYAFALAGSPIPKAVGPEWMRLDLDESAMTTKLAAARGYAAAVGGTLLGEVENLLDRYGQAAFAHEYFQLVEEAPAAEATDAPFYETYGERQVAAGHYEFVIRWHDHVAPIARALLN
jgi:hypothetical protein